MRATSLLTLLLAVSRYNNLQSGQDTRQATLDCNGIKISAEATCCSTAFICWTVREINWGMCQSCVKYLLHLSTIQDLVHKSLVHKRTAYPQREHTVWSSVLLLLPD